jgi:hypothetical protein
MLISKNQKAKEYAATILNTTSNKLLLENSFLVVYIKLEKPSLSVRGLVNTAIVILVLSNLDRDNRLPLF